MDKGIQRHCSALPARTIARITGIMLDKFAQYLSNKRAATVWTSKLEFSLVILMALSKTKKKLSYPGNVCHRKTMLKFVLTPYGGIIGSACTRGYVQLQARRFGIDELAMRLVA